MLQSYTDRLTVVLVLMMGAVSAPALADHQETTLYRFAGGADGAYPYGVILDNDGNLYGVTNGGGNDCFRNVGCGTVFKLAPNGTKTTLHKFAGWDGYSPTGRLSRDSAGTLYGTTEFGGSYASGVIFKLSPHGKLTLLHEFSGGTDGGYPQNVRLVSDDSGNFYGAAGNGGDPNCFQPYGCGVVFRITPQGEYTVVYAFHGGTDGISPFSGVVRDNQGNLYGTTVQGGTGTNCNSNLGCGTVYKIAPDGTETVLHSFDGSSGGYFPDNPPEMDAKGNLYGSTPEGGIATQYWSAGCGVIYKVSADIHFDVLYSFSCGEDGVYPNGGLRIDKNGNLFGNAAFGGRINHGTVFRLDRKGTEHTLYSVKRGEGISPTERMAMDDNYLYGTTNRGGLSHRHKGFGTIFKVAK